MKNDLEAYLKEDKCGKAIQAKLEPFESQIKHINAKTDKILNKINSSKILVTFGFVLWMILVCVF